MSADKWLGIAVVFATFFGPVFAVLLTRYIDDRRERRNRQMQIWRTLMGSRRYPTQQEYVTALNLVDVEFAGIQAIEQGQRDLFRHLNMNHQPPDWFEQLRRLQTRLLFAIGQHLGHRMEQLDVLEGGYMPAAWGNVEEEQRVLRQLLIQQASGKKPVRVEIVAPSAEAPPEPAAAAPAETSTPSQKGRRHETQRE
jgi:hypothetical protein